MSKEKKLVPLTKSKAYSKFIQERDKVLDEIFQKYRAANAAVMTEIKTRTMEIASHIAVTSYGKHFAKMNRENFQRRLQPIFDQAVKQSIGLIQNLRLDAYGLSYVGGAEAIGRALQKKTKIDAHWSKSHQDSNRKTVSGADLFDRVNLAYHRMMTKILDRFHSAQVYEYKTEELLEYIDKAFPPEKKIPKRPKIAKLKEGAQNLGTTGTKLSLWPYVDEETPEELVSIPTMFEGEIDPDLWEQIKQDYAAEYLPYGRGPEDKVFYDAYTSEGVDEQTMYQWELEQEVMNDYVESVRNGDNDSATENGITDFEWIAIIDSKTDVCCSVRDGLLSSEIEEKLKSGELSDEDCDAISAPAHFNCRCRMSPATEDLPEGETPDYSGFSDWLNEET